MNENVKKFFALYDSDPELRARIAAAEAVYPGSLELREALVEEVLLPVAAELALPFTVEELRDYETGLFQRRLQEPDPDDGDPEATIPAYTYWLFGRGWYNDEARFCGDK